jgi:hypothetical protein
MPLPTQLPAQPELKKYEGNFFKEAKAPPL